MLKCILGHLRLKFFKYYHYCDVLIIPFAAVILFFPPIPSSPCLARRIFSQLNSTLSSQQKCSRTATIRYASIYLPYPLLFAANSFLPVHRKLMGKVVFSVGFSSPSSKCLAWGGLEDLLYSDWLMHK